MTWLTLRTSGGRAGRVFLRWFLRHVDRDAVRRELPVAARWRLADPNVTKAERAAVRRLVTRASS